MGNTQQSQESETYSEPDASPLPQKTPKGTDVTFHVNDLLRYTERVIEWDENVNVVREDVNGVEGAFVINNLLTSKECEQLIVMGEEMGYEPSPLSVLSGGFDTSEFTTSTKYMRFVFMNSCSLTCTEIVPVSCAMSHTKCYMSSEIVLLICYLKQ
jgi:hypothetical protein